MYEPNFYKYHFVQFIYCSQSYLQGYPNFWRIKLVALKMFFFLNLYFCFFYVDKVYSNFMFI